MVRRGNPGHAVLYISDLICEVVKDPVIVYRDLSNLATFVGSSRLNR